MSRRRINQLDGNPNESFVMWVILLALLAVLLIWGRDAEAAEVLNGPGLCYSEGRVSYHVDVSDILAKKLPKDKEHKEICRRLAETLKEIEKEKPPPRDVEQPKAKKLAGPETEWESERQTF